MALEQKTGRSAEGALTGRPLLETLGLIVGVVGSTALFLGAVLYALDPNVLQLARANLAFGFVCCIFYVVTNWARLARVMGGRSAPLLGLELVAAVGVLGGVFAVNWSYLDDPTEWDLTRDKLFTLHPQSRDVASKLSGNVAVYGFFAPSHEMRGRLREAVNLYRQHTSNIRFEPINPDQATEDIVKKFDMNPQSARIVVHHEGSDRYIKVSVPTEESITNALLQLSEDSQRTVYVATGHQESSSTDVETQRGFGLARRQLENEGLSIKALSLVSVDQVPDQADALLIVRPKSEFLPNELKALSRFLKRGGRVGVFLEPGETSGLEPLLLKYRVVVGQDLLVETNPAASALQLGDVAPLVQSYEAHPITKVMAGKFSLFFRARSISPGLVTGVSIPELQIATLLQTSSDSFAETSTSGARPRLDERDLAGPVPIAVAVTAPTATHSEALSAEARMVVFGDADFLSNRFVSVRGNLDLFVNSVQWLVGEEDRITIRPPQRVGDRLAISKAMQQGIMFFSVNLLPLVIFGAGLSVWALRRRR